MAFASSLSASPTRQRPGPRVTGRSGQRSPDRHALQGRAQRPDRRPFCHDGASNRLCRVQPHVAAAHTHTRALRMLLSSQMLFGHPSSRASFETALGALQASYPSAKKVGGVAGSLANEDRWDQHAELRVPSQGTARVPSQDRRPT
eukprot:2577176-Rhodomonas_salina.2